MSAIEETWRQCSPPHGHVVIDEDSLITLTAGTNGARPGYAHDRARLAACAPEALRMLLELEWTAKDGMMCEFCGGWESAPFGVGASGHDPTCAWLILMQKAGLR